MWMVYTSPGGGVNITCPSKEFMKAACNGGDNRVATLPINEWIRRKEAQGFNRDAAYRHAMAWYFGGCTTAKAWEIIRDIEPRLKPRPVVVLSPEIVGREFFPADRYFRRAWRRLESGSGIFFDIPLCRLIHLQRMEASVEGWNKRETAEDDLAVLSGRLTNGPAFIEFDRHRMRDVLLRAETPEAIRAVWPADLPRRH